MKEGAGRGAHGLREGVKGDRGQGGGEIKAGKQVEEEHGVRVGVSDGGREGREVRHEGGEAGRGEHAWSEGGSA